MTAGPSLDGGFEELCEFLFSFSSRSAIFANSNWMKATASGGHAAIISGVSFGMSMRHTLPQVHGKRNLGS